jgi:hypothetical protein
MILVTPKAGAKHGLLFNEPASGYHEEFNCTGRIPFVSIPCFKGVGRIRLCGPVMALKSGLTRYHRENIFLMYFR